MTVSSARGGSLRARLSSYFASDSSRALQTALGLVWLLDGGLQFQSFMYSHGFVEMLTANAPGQPGWLANSVEWGVHLAEHNLSVWNTLFALTQVAIGLGLLYRPTVRPALCVSFVWALVVWWFGEAFGMLFMNMASPLTGAPGAVLLYALVGLLVWPNGRPGGLLGVRGAKLAWAALWLVMAWLWLLEPNSSANATRGAIEAAPSGISWLSTVQQWAAEGAKGNGLPIAMVLAALSAAIGLAVAFDWHPRRFIVAAIVLNLLYWTLGQGFGGIFEGGATDPNSGLLFVVLALAMLPLASGRRRRAGREPAAEGRYGAIPVSPGQPPVPQAARLARGGVVGLLVAGLLGGCAAADKHGASSASNPSPSSSSSSASAGNPGMNMAAGPATAVSANGIHPLPTQILGTATWQGMKITAMATTPVPFVVYNGTSSQLVKPGKASLHLMVMLNDASTDVPIPYATVWATITKNGKVIFDERQWPMISRYMGPHYGNDVTLPGPGTYTLSLLVSPPVSARHIEYEKVWLTPHRVTFTFPWKRA
ncbi:MAG TPA: iron transporter [Solirubrobacteraceae bacterium]|nr:iron transporter [Solirubrobacteraceae bacterium]